MAKKSAKKPVSISLDGELSIYQAAKIKTELLEALSAVNELNVDLAGVTEIDSAGLQLLMMLKKEAVRQGKQVALINHSPAVVNVFEAINVVGQFGDPLLISSAR